MRLMTSLRVTLAPITESRDQRRSLVSQVGINPVKIHVSSVQRVREETSLSLSFLLSLNSFTKIAGANIVRRVSRLRFRFSDVGSLRLRIAGNTRATVIGGSLPLPSFSVTSLSAPLYTASPLGFRTFSFFHLPRPFYEPFRAAAGSSLRKCVQALGLTIGISGGWILRAEFCLDNAISLVALIFIRDRRLTIVSFERGDALRRASYSALFLDNPFGLYSPGICSDNPRVNIYIRASSRASWRISFRSPCRATRHFVIAHIEPFRFISIITPAYISLTYATACSNLV